MLDALTGALYTSAVLVRVPPRHRFPLHTHPRSEDCFFVLSGSGELVGADQSLPISESTVVWISVGVPHGVVAGPSGMFEIGFQSPPGPTVSHLEVKSAASGPCGMLAESLPAHPQSPGPWAEWVPVFQGLESRYFQPHYSVLDTSQQLLAEADGYELVVIVARGAVGLPKLSMHVSAFAALQVCPGEAVELRALESPTLLLGIRALLTA
ncbi:MAG: cupin domain-containing protein [Terriglobia bacterium]